MEGSASAIEQQHYAQRLIATGERLRRRADEMNHPVICHMELTDVQRAEPAVLVKDRYVYPKIARRAQMILWESAGLAIGKIAALVRVSRSMLNLWRRRYRDGRLPLARFPSSAPRVIAVRWPVRLIDRESANPDVYVAEDYNVAHGHPLSRARPPRRQKL